MRRVRQQVAVVALAIVIYNVPRFLEFRVEYLDEQATTDHQSSHPEKKVEALSRRKISTPSCIPLLTLLHL